MHAYLRPSGINGLRFNARKSAQAKRDKLRKEEQKAETIKRLKLAKTGLDEKLPQLWFREMGLMVAYWDREGRTEVRDSVTGQLLGYVTDFDEVIPC
ncbi:MAG: hypothetical protein RR800_00455 [Comamonas sp.]